MKYQPIVGLEIHIELKTDSKMFCSCKNDPNEKRPNFNICPICLGHPGTLPVINKEAVRKTIKTGLALNCKIPKESKFDRKNYFYPDLPKGYQISQYDMPFCKSGYLELEEVRPRPEGRGRISNKLKKIRINRVHLEEDTGKLIHEKDCSLVDFNRAGVPLMELVTEPDITSAKEARKFAEELQLILRYLDVSDADMEKGQLRVEVNISLTKTKKLGTKVEIKNLNSFKSVEKAIGYEIKRQTGVLDGGGKIIQETRGWDDVKGVTVSQRKKEEAHDYRYFPEPDLPTLRLDEDFINSVKMGIPEIPSQKRKRFVREYGLELKDIEIFVNNKDLGDYFEKTMSELTNWIKEEDFKKDVSRKEFLKLTNLALNYIVTDFWSLFDKVSLGELEQKIKPENFAELIKMLYKGEISSKIAKQILPEMLKGADPSNIIEEKGMTQIDKADEIEIVVKEVISKNSKAVEDYRKGKEASLQFLVGQVMAATQGRAKPDIVREILKRLLK